MHIDLLTLFPEMISGILDNSILKKAQEKDKFSCHLINFRDYSENKHGKVDDYPYGGGAGMVLTPQPVFDAVSDVKEKSSISPRVLLMCPQGEPYTQRKAEELAREEHLIIICGHYEGFDERIREHLATDEVSIGDYVLTGGELGAMVVVDSVVRLLPEVLGNHASASHDSFSTGLLEHPHYTRPADFRGMEVPDVLRSGDHAKIEEWRRKESLQRTYERRKELIDTDRLSEEDMVILDRIKQDYD